jgi:uncharacterized protein
VSIRFSVRLTPRGGRDAADGVDPAGTLRVRVAAPPVDGAANEALIRFLARELGVAPSAVRIEAGEGSRVKRLNVAGVDAASVSARWPGLRCAEAR